MEVHKKRINVLHILVFFVLNEPETIGCLGRDATTSYIKVGTLVKPEYNR